MNLKTEFIAICKVWTSVARYGVFTLNWLFFNAYGGEKVVLGIVMGFWLFFTWPLY